jgi:uncharacterized protein (DUF305 family)
MWRKPKPTRTSASGTRRGRLLWPLPVLVALTFAVAGCGGGQSGEGEAAEGGGDVFDRAFIDGMVPHHEGAIEMAEAAKAAGLSESELVEIADAIIATQQEEIDEMRAWRRDWFGSAEVDPAGAEALGMSAAEMGMQHDASVLAEAEDVDATFAAMMIDHHRGAIAMAELAQQRSRREEILRLAEEIVRAQEREIAVMERHAAGEHDGH